MKMEIALQSMVHFGKMREIKPNFFTDKWMRIPFCLYIGKRLIFGELLSTKPA
jgi:hypothetical protein